MTLYSNNGQRPAPLPFRITLPDGFTRTDPRTFTAEEIQSAGFSGPYAEPDYDPATERLDWIDGEYVVTALPEPAPTPDWPAFKSMALRSAALNQVLAQAYQLCPVAAGALAPALLKAEGNGSGDFAAAWGAIIADCGIPSELIEEFVQAAENCRLPNEFVAALNPAPQRARDEQGRFIADDPSTPEDEAWVLAE